MGCNCGNSEWHIPDDGKPVVMTEPPPESGGSRAIPQELEQEQVPVELLDPVVSAEEINDTPDTTLRYQKRLEQCASCDDLQRYHTSLPKGADVGTLDRCGICGCWVKAKAAVGVFHCPANKW